MVLRKVIENLGAVIPSSRDWRLASGASSSAANIISGPLLESESGTTIFCSSALYRRDIRFPPINRRRAGVPPENFRCSLRRPAFGILPRPAGLKSTSTRWMNSTATRWMNFTATRWMNSTATRWMNFTATRWMNSTGIRWTNSTAARRMYSTSTRWTNSTATRWMSSISIRRIISSSTRWMNSTSTHWVTQPKTYCKR